MPSFKVQCPSCEAPVLIKNPDLVGKKVECPKCKYRFKVEAPARPAAGNDPAAGPAAAAAPAGPPGQETAPNAAGEKPKKPKKPLNKKLIAGVGLGVVVVSLV